LTIGIEFRRPVSGIRSTNHVHDPELFVIRYFVIRRHTHIRYRVPCEPCRFRLERPRHE